MSVHELRGRVVQLSPTDARSRALSSWTGLAAAVASTTILVAAVTVVAVILRLRGGAPQLTHAVLPALACLASTWASATFEAARARVGGTELPAWRLWAVGGLSFLLLLRALGAPAGGPVAWPVWVLSLATGLVVAALLLRASWKLRPTWHGPRGELLGQLAGGTFCGGLASLAWGLTALGLWSGEGSLAAAWIVGALLQALLAASAAGVALLLWSRALRSETGRLSLGVPVGAAWAHAQLLLSLAVAVTLFFT